MTNDNTYTKKKHLIKRAIRIPFPCKNDNNFEFKVSLESEEEGRSKPYNIRNISSTGVAIVFDDDEEINKYNEITTPIRLFDFKLGNNILPNLELDGSNLKLDGQVYATRRCSDSEKKTEQYILLIIKFLFIPDNEDHKKAKKSIKGFVSLKRVQLKNYLKDSAFRNLVKKEVKLRTNESLYKYLDRILRFMGGFINYDVGMVGYVVQDEGDKEGKVITVEDTIFVGSEIGRTKQIIINDNLKLQWLKGLDGEDRNFETNQIEDHKDPKDPKHNKHSCMAHSKISEKIYYIKYPEKTTNETAEKKEKNYKAYFEENRCKVDDGSSCMIGDDIDAASLGKFNRTDPDIRSEITVPIRPWLRYVCEIDKKQAGSKDVLLEFFNTLEKNKDINDGIKIVKDYTIENGCIYNGKIEDQKDDVLVIANDQRDENLLCILFRKPKLISKDNLSKLLVPLRNTVSEFIDEYNGGKSSEDSIRLLNTFSNDIKVDDTNAKINHNEVVALLHFESVAKDDNFSDSIRKILKIIREEAEIEIAGAFDYHYWFFRKILYRSITTYLMGEPQHALIELGKWREVQCSNIFNKFDCLRDIFYGYIEFLKREVDSYFVVDKEDEQYEEDCCYGKLVHIHKSNECPDSRADGCGGVGLLFNQKKDNQDNSNLTAMQGLCVSLLQLFSILDSIKKGNSTSTGESEKLKKNKYSIYLKKADIISSQIQQDVHAFIKNLSLISVDNFSNWDTLLGKIKTSKSLAIELLKTKLKEADLEEIKDAEKLTGKMKKAIVDVFNEMKNNQDFHKEDIANKNFNFSSDLHQKLNKNRDIFNISVEKETSISLQKEKIKGLNIEILKELFSLVSFKFPFEDGSVEETQFQALEELMKKLPEIGRSDITKLHVEDSVKSTIVAVERLEKVLHPQFHEYLPKNTDDRDLSVKRILNHLIHMSFFIGIAQLHHIIRQRDGSLEMTLNDFEIVDIDKKAFISRFIRTCSLLILSESVSSTNEEIKRTHKNGEDQRPEISIPVIIGYMYRARAFSYVGPKSESVQ